MGRHVAGRALRHDAPAVGPSAGPHVDHPVGVGDDVQVVLDDDDGGAAVDEALEHVEEDLHVVGVQSDGRLVEDEERSLLAPPHLRGEFEPLRLASGQGGRGLAERQVAQAQARQRAEQRARSLQAPHRSPRVVHAHGHDVGQAQPVAPDPEGLGAVAAPPAVRALDVHVGQELHVEGDLARPVARGAAQRARVVGEGARLEARRPRLPGARERPAQLVQDTGVRGDCGAHVDADGRRVDQVDARDSRRVHVPHVRGEGLPRQGRAQGGHQGLQDHRRLARSADPGDRRERSHWDVDAQGVDRVDPRGLQVDGAAPVTTWAAAPVRSRALPVPARPALHPAPPGQVRADAGAGGA